MKQDDLVKKCMESSEAEIKALLDRQKQQMVEDLSVYDVSLKTIESQAKEIESDVNIDPRTKEMLLQGLREYWGIKRARNRTETKGSTRR